MTPALSQSNSPHKNAPYGFILGVLGGMAAYYLTQSKSGRKLRHQLVGIYDTAKIESGQWLEEFVIPSHEHPSQTSDTVIHPSPKPSLLTRLKEKLAKKPAVSHTNQENPKTKTKRYFQQTYKKKR